METLLDYILEVIKKCKASDKDSRPDKEQKICLYTKDGKRLLGRHPNKKSAFRQEKVVQMKKHQG
jgi:hypothetical protein